MSSRRCLRGSGTVGMRWCWSDDMRSTRRSLVIVSPRLSERDKMRISRNYTANALMGSSPGAKSGTL